MAGKGELAEKWSGAKDKSKKLAAADAGAKKAFEKLVKALNKDLGGHLDKVDKAAEAGERAGFDTVADKARKIMASYRDLIDNAVQGPLTAEMVKPIVFALAPQKQGAIPDMISEMGKSVTGVAQVAVFLKHSPKISPAWLKSAVAPAFQAHQSFDDMQSRFNGLEHFIDGRASYDIASLDRVVNAVDAFERDIQGRADGESLKTLAKLRALVKAQEGPVKSYIQKQQDKAADKDDAFRAAAEKMSKEIKDYAKAVQTVHMRVVGIDGDSRTLVDSWQDAMGPAKKAPFESEGATMLVTAEKLEVAVGKLAGMFPTTSGLEGSIEKIYGQSVPRPVAALQTKLEKDLQGLDAQRKELVILIKDTVTRLTRFRP